MHQEGLQSGLQIRSSSRVTLFPMRPLKLSDLGVIKNTQLGLKMEFFAVAYLSVEQ